MADKSVNSLSANLVAPVKNPLGVALVNSKYTHKIHNPDDLVELARQVQTADVSVRSSASAQLRVIAEQIRFLQEQAKKVLVQAKKNTDLNHVACNMVKKPGQTYYLYERRDDDSRLLSILSPAEWGKLCPHKYIGGYRLEADMSWTPVDEVEKYDAEQAAIDRVLSTDSLSLLPTTSQPLSLEHGTTTAAAATKSL